MTKLPTPPLTEVEIDRLMAALGPLGSQPTIAVGVSGGPDSLALLAALAGWSARAGGAVIALTVDHGLRPESADEAALAADAARLFGVAHHVLRWTGPKPKTGLQAAARDARRGLLNRWCRDQGVLYLALAHHRDDQIETVIQRLGHGSGVDGLAGMRLVTVDDAVLVLRPFLEVAKPRLVASVDALGLAAADDPTNASPDYARGRVRAASAALTALGLDGPGLALVAEKQARARDALNDIADGITAQAVSIAPERYALIDPAPIEAAPEDLRGRILATVLAAVRARPYPVRDRRLLRLLRGAIAGEGLLPARPVTLGGCLLQGWRGRLLIHRESVQTHRSELPPGGSISWDGRFRITDRRDSGPPLEVGRLETTGIAAARALGLGTALARIPPPVRPGLPAIRDGKRLVTVPHVDDTSFGIEPCGPGRLA